MSSKNKVILFVLMVIVSYFLLSTPVLADDDNVFGDERPIFPLVSNEQGREFGNLTIALLILGMIYVVIKRFYIYIKRFIDKEEHPEIIEYSKKIYMNSRKPLFYLHLSVNLLATGFGIVHGLSVEIEDSMMLVTGIIAVIIMVVLSISGLIMWKKFWPFWSNRESKKLINAVHRQWLFSAILIVVIWAHLFIFRES